MAPKAVLVGMPGSGKSTIGRRLAKAMDLPLLDTDAAIVETTGRTIADMEWQRERFRTHIRAARQTGLPLVIHTRQASDDTIAILKEEGESGGAGDRKSVV